MSGRDVHDPGRRARDDLLILRALVVIGAAGLGLVPAAVAGWGTSGSGVASARAATLAAPSALTAVVSGTSTKTVTLTWTPVPEATAYSVHRYDVLGTLVGAGGTCAGSVTATTCDDTNLPPGMTWTFGVVPHAGSWHGSESPRTTVTT